MVDVIKTLGIEYVAATPGSSFEGLHESIINSGENRMPRIVDAVESYATVGEISDAMRRVFGEYKETVVV